MSELICLVCHSEQVFVTNNASAFEKEKAIVCRDCGSLVPMATFLGRPTPPTVPQHKPITFKDGMAMCAKECEICYPPTAPLLDPDSDFGIIKALLDTCLAATAEQDVAQSTIEYRKELEKKGRELLKRIKVSPTEAKEESSHFLQEAKPTLEFDHPLAKVNSIEQRIHEVVIEAIRKEFGPGAKEELNVDMMELFFRLNEASNGGQFPVDCQEVLMKVLPLWLKRFAPPRAKRLTEEEIENLLERCMNSHPIDVPNNIMVDIIDYWKKLKPILAKALAEEGI